MGELQFLALPPATGYRITFRVTITLLQLRDRISGPVHEASLGTILKKKLRSERD